MLTTIQAYPVYPTGIHVQWDVDNQTLPGDYKFIVTLLSNTDILYSSGIIYNVNFIDIPQTNLQSKDLRQFFSITVTVKPPIIDPQKGILEETKSIPLYPTLNKQDFAKAKTIVKKEQTRFRVKVGVPFNVFKRKLFGPICPICTDPITKHCSNSKCLKCFGTSIDGGYLAYIPLLGELEEGPVQKNLTQVDTQEVKQAKIRLDNAVLLSKKDIVYDAIHGRMWIVIDDVTIQTYKSYPISQTTIVSEVSPKNITYKLI